MRQVSLPHFIERKLRFKEINLHEVTELEGTKVGFGFRALTQAALVLFFFCFGSKYIPLQPVFSIVAFFYMFRLSTRLNNPSTCWEVQVGKGVRKP